MFFPSESLPAEPTTAGNLRWLLQRVRSVLGDIGLTGALLLLLHRRIGVIARRLALHLARFEAGTLRPYQPRGAAAVSRREIGQPAPRRDRRKPDVVLPRRFGWLVAKCGYHAAGFGSQLAHQLNQPEMVALLEASPAARRNLRPLCRALGVELPWTVTPPRPPRPSREKTPRTPRQRRYAVASDFIPPLPRGVLAWARREGYGKRPEAPEILSELKKRSLGIA
jgi:hypothetical protein